MKLGFQKRKRYTISKEFENEFYKLDYIHNYIVIQQIKHCLFRHIKTGLL